jgi:hypothetical protein
MYPPFAATKIARPPHFQPRSLAFQFVDTRD